MLKSPSVPSEAIVARSMLSTEAPASPPITSSELPTTASENARRAVTSDLAYAANAPIVPSALIVARSMLARLPPTFFQPPIT
ncbi:hypothetical protein D3C83_98060 [compost metagenome]